MLKSFKWKMKHILRKYFKVSLHSVAESRHCSSSTLCDGRTRECDRLHCPLLWSGWNYNPHEETWIQILCLQIHDSIRGGCLGVCVLFSFTKYLELLYIDKFWRCRTSQHWTLKTEKVVPVSLFYGILILLQKYLQHDFIG